MHTSDSLFWSLFEARPTERDGSRSRSHEESAGNGKENIRRILAPPFYVSLFRPVAFALNRALRTGAEQLAKKRILLPLHALLCSRLPVCPAVSCEKDSKSDPGRAIKKFCDLEKEKEIRSPVLI